MGNLTLAAARPSPFTERDWMTRQVLQAMPGLPAKADIASSGPKRSPLYYSGEVGGSRERSYAAPKIASCFAMTKEQQLRRAVECRPAPHGSYARVPVCPYVRWAGQRWEAAPC